MIVSELIDYLQTVPPDIKVIVHCAGGWGRDIPSIMVHVNPCTQSVYRNSETGTVTYRDAPAGTTIRALAEEIIQAVVL